jgi:hypothetical protein
MRKLRRAMQMQAHVRKRHGEEQIRRLMVVVSEPVAIEDQAFLVA